MLQFVRDPGRKPADRRGRLLGERALGSTLDAIYPIGTISIARAAWYRGELHVSYVDAAPSATFSVGGVGSSGPKPSSAVPKITDVQVLLGVGAPNSADVIAHYDNVIVRC